MKNVHEFNHLIVFFVKVALRRTHSAFVPSCHDDISAVAVTKHIYNDGNTVCAAILATVTV